MTVRTKTTTLVCSRAAALILIIAALAVLFVPAEAGAQSSTRTQAVLPQLMFMPYFTNDIYANPADAAAASEAEQTAEQARDGVADSFGPLQACPKGGDNSSISGSYFNGQSTVWCAEVTTCEFGECSNFLQTVASALILCPSGWSLAQSAPSTVDADGVVHHTEVCQTTVPDVQRCPCGPSDPAGDGSEGGSGGFGNPIFGEDGSKRQVETDYADPSGRLAFRRTYRSDQGQFRSNFHSQFRPPGVLVGVQIGPTSPALPYESLFCSSKNAYIGNTTPAPPMCFAYANDPANAAEIQAVTPSGFLERFSWSGSSATPVYSSSVDNITQTTVNGVTYWLWLRTREGIVEKYDPTGVLLQRYFASGGVQTFTYSDSTTSPDAAPGPGYLIGVADQFGRQLSFTYDSVGRMVSLHDPAGGTTTYSYLASDPTAPLGSVTYADGTTRQYSWDESSNITNPVQSAPHLLTGITDEEGRRYATFSYNGTYASATEHAGGVERYQFSNLSPFNSVNVTDPLGTLHSYSYNSVAGLVTQSSETRPACPGCGNVTSQTSYDNNSNPVQHTDFNGNKTCFAYDTTRNLESVRIEGVSSSSVCPANVATYQIPPGSAQRRIQTAWHPTWQLPVLRAEPGKLTTWVYNGQPDPMSGGTPASCAPANAVLPTGETLAVVCREIEQATGDINGSSGFSAALQNGVPARVWQWTYDANGQVLSQTDPLNHTTTYSYYADTLADHTSGDLRSITNALSQIEVFDKYTPGGLLLQSTSANGIVTTRSYDQRQRLASVATAGEVSSFLYWPTGLLQSATLPDLSSVQFNHDAAHRLVQTSDSLGNRIAYTLDAIGNRTATGEYDSNGVLHRTHSRAINALNQIAQEINSAGTAAVATSFIYDANGNRSAMSAPLSRNTLFQYDELNRLTLSTDTNSGHSGFAYDGADRLLSHTDPRGLVTSYQYSGLGDLLQISSPDSGVTTRTYDAAGHVTTATDARGAVAAYSYDNLNRVSSIQYSTAGLADQILNFSYDAGENGKGRLTGAADSNHSMSWAYDSSGRKQLKSQSIGGVTLSVQYMYSAGDLAALTMPSGRTVSYTYNGNHQISSVSVDNQPVLGNITYEPSGSVNGWTWGNGTATARTHDTDGNISQISSAGNIVYGRDDATRVTSVTDPANPSTAWSFEYDGLDRLTSASSAEQSQAFAYDSSSNRLTEEGSNGEIYHVGQSNNRLTSVAGALTRTYSYDASGNVNGYGPSFTYNSAGRMTSALNGSQQVTYLYNALGERIRKTSSSSTTDFVYDEVGHLLGEYGDGDVAIQEIVWLGDIPVAVIRTGSCGLSIFYVHTDRQNTPRRITQRSTNSVVWQWDSDPFGGGLPNENPSGLGTFRFNLRFPGQYYDAETGLDYNYFRYYDPATGAFLQSDPIGLEGGFNGFEYSGANPLGAVDPLGLVEEREEETEVESGMDVIREAQAASILNQIKQYDPNYEYQAWRAPNSHLDETDIENLREELRKLRALNSCRNTESPALKTSPYNPSSVESRTRPPYKANPAHDPDSPLYNPKKDPEPTDAQSVYDSAQRGGIGEWYGEGQGGWYRFSSDNAGTAHFSGIMDESRVPISIRRGNN